jgi:hypothetical protein
VDGFASGRELDFASASRRIVLQRLAAQTNENWKSLAAFLDECETPEMRNLVTEAVAEDRKIPNPEQQLAMSLRNCGINFWTGKSPASPKKSASRACPKRNKMNCCASSRSCANKNARRCHRCNVGGTACRRP